MQEYRAYLLDESGRISNAAIFIRQDNDEDAIEAAKQFLNGRALDLWQGTRRVMTLKNDNKPHQLQTGVFL
jgi:hypothetical protein